MKNDPNGPNGEATLSVQGGEPFPTRHARVITITSGKGGVGKTSVCANLGIALAQAGHSVCIFDADMGLANINILIGRQPQYTLEHLITGEKRLDELSEKRQEFGRSAEEKERK